MRKRRFLAGSALLGLLPAVSQPATAAAASAGPALLTISGDIGKTNRGPFDPVLDQMMGKHGVRFQRAFAFDAAALRRLPSTTIRPTLEYDAMVHVLAGPLLSTVLAAAGVASDRAVQLGLRAVDGYTAAIGLQDARAYRMVIATQLDGRPLGLGGLGPQWALIDADNVAPFKDKPLKERFALCPWGLYHIAVAGT